MGARTDSATQTRSATGTVITTVYDEVLSWIESDPTMHSAQALGHIVLGLYDGGTCPLDLGTAINRLDSDRRAWAKTIILDYLENGETQALRDAGERIAKIYPEFKNWSDDANVLYALARKSGATRLADLLGCEYKDAMEICGRAGMYQGVVTVK